MNEYIDATLLLCHPPVEAVELAVPEIVPRVMSSSDPINGASIRDRAQKLHTDVYLQKGFISEQQLDTAGVYVDEYSARSGYLLSKDNNRESACRYIRATKEEGGIMSLPTARHFSIDPEVIKLAAGIDRLSDLKASEVIEVSGLASIHNDNKRSGELDVTRMLYASIIRQSLDEGHKLWLLNVDPLLLRSLKLLIGNEQVHQLGDKADYVGPATIPVAINPQAVVQAAFADGSDLGAIKQQYLREELPGVRAKYLSKATKDALAENDIPYSDDKLIKRVATNPRTAAYAAIIGYSALRPLAVTGVNEFHGSVAALWAIDVATAVPYTWGLVETVAAKKPLRRALGATVAAGTFVAPYAYFWAEGQDYPPYVNAVVGGFIGMATLSVIAKGRQDRKLATALQASGADRYE